MITVIRRIAPQASMPPVPAGRHDTADVGQNV